MVIVAVVGGGGANLQAIKQHQPGFAMATEGVEQAPSHDSCWSREGWTEEVRKEGGKRVAASAEGGTHGASSWSPSVLQEHTPQS